MGRRAGDWLPRARDGDACAHVKLVFLTGRARPAELSYSRRSSGAAPPLRGPTKHLIRPIRCGSHRKRGVGGAAAPCGAQRPLCRISHHLGTVASRSRTAPHGPTRPHA